jgi:hypothetical protein
MLIDILHTSLFATEKERAIGVGFHNIGGVLRASNPAVVAKLDAHYGERCGHLPLDAQKLRVLVEIPTPAIDAHMVYLSQLFGKEIKAVTRETLHAECMPGERPLVVPYVNVPEADQYVKEVVDAELWGLPAAMVHVLKNKVEFYRLADELNAADDSASFRAPDYTISVLDELPDAACNFLAQIEDLYVEAGLSAYYPLGIILRAAESDGNYGSCILSARGNSILLVRDGDADVIQTYSDWKTALLAAQSSLEATMHVEKERRIVISRLVDLADSPGLSVVMLDGYVESLRWNGQLQGQESKACVGTSTYVPKTDYLRNLQQRHEDQTAHFFITLLRQVALKSGIDFTTIRGLANIDIMLPGALEVTLQQKRKQLFTHYLAECNPRWTNYTDAIMNIIAVSRKEPTIRNMQSVIREGISTIDKSPLPPQLDPSVVREHIYKLDDTLKQQGTRIICRMAKNPMGLIFAGDIQKAQQEFDHLIAQLATQANHSFSI